MFLPYTSIIHPEADATIADKLSASNRFICSCIPTFRTLKCHILPQLYTELLDGSDKVDSLLGAVA
jgi:hypothetical protein